MVYCFGHMEFFYGVPRKYKCLNSFCGEALLPKVSFQLDHTDEVVAYILWPRLSELAV